MIGMGERTDGVAIEISVVGLFDTGQATRVIESSCRTARLHALDTVMTMIDTSVRALPVLRSQPGAGGDAGDDPAEFEAQPERGCGRPWRRC